MSNAVATTAEYESGNVGLALGAGLVAALIGAAIWMGITVATGMHIGYVALGIGALVGYAVRVAGKGFTPVYGVIGALLTLLGCLLGQIAAEVQLATKEASMGFFEVIHNVGVVQLVTLVLQNTGPITYFIYAIGIYEGYKLSINR